VDAGAVLDPGSISGRVTWMPGTTMARSAVSRVPDPVSRLGDRVPHMALVQSFARNVRPREGMNVEQLAA
jgi:hypothetical protein